MSISSKIHVFWIKPVIANYLIAANRNGYIALYRLCSI
jgi:hypothetical protein